MSDEFQKVELPPHKKSGPKELQLDEQRIENAAALFWTYEEIAVDQGCSVDTLQNRYTGIIEKGKQRGKASLRATQFQLAMGKPAVEAKYLRKDGNPAGELVLDEKGRPIKTADYQPPLAPNVTMSIWMGKQHLGQSDKVDFPDDTSGFSFPKKPQPKEPVTEGGT